MGPDSEVTLMEDELTLFSMQDMINLCEELKSYEFTPGNILEMIDIIRNVYTDNHLTEPRIKTYSEEIKKYFGGSFISLFDISGSSEESDYRITGFNLDLVALLLIREEQIEENLDCQISPGQLASSNLEFFTRVEDEDSLEVDLISRYETKEARDLYKLLKQEKYYEFFFDMQTFEWEDYGITYILEEGMGDIKVTNGSGISLPENLLNRFLSGFNDRLVVPLLMYVS
jgi:hypothetical protein